MVDQICPNPNEMWVQVFEECIERPVDITPPKSLDIPQDNQRIPIGDPRIDKLLATAASFSTFDDWARFQLQASFLKSRRGGPEGAEFGPGFSQLNEGWDYNNVDLAVRYSFRLNNNDLQVRLAPTARFSLSSGNANTFDSDLYLYLGGANLALDWRRAFRYAFNAIWIEALVGYGHGTTISSGALLHNQDGFASEMGAGLDVVCIPIMSSTHMVLGGEVTHPTVHGENFNTGDVRVGGFLRLDIDSPGETNYLPYGVERCDLQKQRMDRIQGENRTFRTEIVELTGNFDKFHQLLTDAPELSSGEKAAITAAFKAINPNLDIEQIKDLLDPIKMRDVNRSIYKVVLESQAREIEAAMIKEAQDAGRVEQDINDNVRPTIASRLAALRLDAAGIDTRVAERFPDDYNFWTLYPNPYETRVNEATCRDVDDTYSRLTGEHSQLSTNKEQIIRKLELLALIFGRVEKSERVVRGAAYSFANVRFQVNRPDGKTPKIFDETFDRLKRDRTDLNMASLKKDGREDRAALSAFTTAINIDLNDHWLEYIEASTQLKRMNEYTQKVREGTLSFPVALDGKLDADGKKTAKAFTTALSGVYGNLAAEFVNQNHTAEVFLGKLSPDPANPLKPEELEEIKTKGIVIRAHTSGEADAFKNLHLSARRAIAAKLYLMAQGIPAERIKIYAFGELMPRFAEVGNKKTKDYFRELNRRIEYYFDDGSVPQFDIAPASIGEGAEAAPTDIGGADDAEDEPEERTPQDRAMGNANWAGTLANRAQAALTKGNKADAKRLAGQAISSAEFAIKLANTIKPPYQAAIDKAQAAKTKAEGIKTQAEAIAEPVGIDRPQ